MATTDGQQPTEVSPAQAKYDSACAACETEHKKLVEAKLAFEAAKRARDTAEASFRLARAVREEARAAAGPQPGDAPRRGRRGGRRRAAVAPEEPPTPAGE
jgi:hypothetical protein